MKELIMKLASTKALIMRDEAFTYRHTGKFYGTKRNKFYPVSPSVSKHAFSINKLKQRLKNPGGSGYFVPFHFTKFQNDVGVNTCDRCWMFF